MVRLDVAATKGKALDTPALIVLREFGYAMVLTCLYISLELMIDLNAQGP